MEPFVIALMALVGLTLLLCLWLLRRLQQLEQQLQWENRRLYEGLSREFQQARQESNSTALEHQRLLNEYLSARLQSLDQSIQGQSVRQEEKLEAIRTTVEKRLFLIQRDNQVKLDEIRGTVEEKLQKTLEERIGHSFKLVSDRLEQVYKGLGEMHTLAEGVGDLKKVLSNVKTRGILGEVQLGAILDQLLAPEQYATNCATKKGSRDLVEYAVRLPGPDQDPVWLPIDAKFPADAYSQLMDAYESGQSADIASASALLEQRIRRFAKDIRDKYLDPPATTDFALMFLPFEGLYAEVVRRGLIESLQKDYKVVIAGPTTMAALLNSLQMGFRTLALQKRSSEVWNVLGAVKTEFEKFGQVLSQTQQRLEQAHQELDKLVGVRTRQIQRKLQSVTELPETESLQWLGDSEEAFQDVDLSD